MAKINLKRGLTDIVLYLIIFIVVQIIVMYAGVGIWASIKGEGYQATLLAISSGSNPILTALTSAFSNVITLVIFLKTKWTPLTRDYLLSKPWATLLWVALFALGTIIPLEFIYEQIGIEMDENTEVNLGFDKEMLYKNVVDAKADWLYELPQWDEILTPDKRKELYKSQKVSGTVRKGKKIFPNDPCPCGSGKKYKQCHGKGM